MGGMAFPVWHGPASWEYPITFSVCLQARDGLSMRTPLLEPEDVRSRSRWMTRRRETCRGACFDAGLWLRCLEHCGQWGCISLLPMSRPLRRSTVRVTASLLWLGAIREMRED